MRSPVRRARQLAVPLVLAGDSAALIIYGGPFAEDFHAAFGVGTDNRSIGLLDIDGINFAGVRALEQRIARLEALLQTRPKP